MWLTAQPENIVAAVDKATHRRRDAIYTRRIWKPTMLAL